MIRIGVALMALAILFQVHQQEMEGLQKRDSGETRASNKDLGAGKSWTMGTFVFLIYGLIVNRFWLPLAAGAACSLLDYIIFSALTHMRSILLFTVWVRLHNIVYVILLPFELVAAALAGALNAWTRA